MTKNAENKIEKDVETLIHNLEWLEETAKKLKEYLQNREYVPSDKYWFDMKLGESTHELKEHYRYTIRTIQEINKKLRLGSKVSKDYYIFQDVRNLNWYL